MIFNILALIFCLCAFIYSLENCIYWSKKIKQNKKDFEKLNTEYIEKYETSRSSGADNRISG